ncbi:MAG: protein-L-isoaspartate(D-aspartate) O-methyltransferase [candidate division Zixibacteria bacterium]|jgi:protein-L-isoaspartate(D-aspartate) O-methyltransferase|nr:protein-L-isoaspartate(D-aspartate) O-methyltransferase [candidate division Zixibacteria bacterium]
MNIAALGIACLLAAAGEFAADRAVVDSMDRESNDRINMVRDQIEARGIKNKAVLESMRNVPRHLFIPENLRHEAYEDEPVPIGYGQTISQPYIVALMTELLELSPDSKVLEIGTGSGYQAAILSTLADSVFSIEIIPELAATADSTLKKLGYEVTVRCGDGYRGWPEHAPFDAIIVTAAPEKIPRPLVDQLAENGRLVIPVGSYYQELKLIRKIKGQLIETNIAPVRFVPMTGETEK